VLIRLGRPNARTPRALRRGPTLPGAIRTHVGARLAVVEISQAARRNALTQQMALDLRDSLQGPSARDDLGCVLLHGDGPLAFCAGADISEFGERRGDPEVARQFDSVVSVQRTHLELRP
jgi:enoyl-CoA hydratase/carnithine racemase